MQIVGCLLTAAHIISYQMYFQVVSKSALEDAKQLVLSAFDDNNDGRIDIAEVCRHFHLLLFVLSIHSYILLVDFSIHLT